jgi:hypothetical protein
LKEPKIEYKITDEIPVAMLRTVVKTKQDVLNRLTELRERMPAEAIAGPPFCVFQFISSIQDGFEVDLGFPVHQAAEINGLKIARFPSLQVLTLVHHGPLQESRKSAGLLFRAAAERALISDEFYREIYHDVRDPEQSLIEIHFVLHDWTGRLERNVERVLGRAARQEIMAGCQALTIESTPDERFEWVKGAMERLDRLATEPQKYDAVSSCAHVFPPSQIAKLRAVYVEALAQVDDPLLAVDAVLDFMATDPGWGERPRREGRVLYAAKAPRDPQGYENARDEMEKRKAYCFCPLVRDDLDGGMPRTFCYCGAGWYRQQWETTLGRPVQIEIVQSVLRGDEVCQFAIHLPAER